ncbi:MAG: sensor histidine kinase, partial [Candidatus Aminicenantales bacterium]
NLQLNQVKEPGVKAAFRESQNRIQSMALIHERLYKSRDLSRVNFSEYLRSLAVHLFHIYQIDSNLIRLKVDTEEVFLDINTAIPCALLVNELISNSLKYAVPEGRSGELTIELKRIYNRRYKLSVRDNGIGLPEDFDIKNTKSLGVQIVGLLTDQLGGILKFSTNGGAAFSLEFEELKYKKECRRWEK